MPEVVKNYIATFGFTPAGDGMLWGHVAYALNGRPDEKQKTFTDAKFVKPEDATEHARKRFDELVEAGFA